MAFSLNKITLIGNLGNDAETRFTTNNVSVTSFSLATTHSYKGKDGNWVNETTWHNVVAFSLPDWYKESLKKGKKFYVEGRLSKRDYTDKDGIKRYVTEVVAMSSGIIPLDARDSSSHQNNEIVGPEVGGERLDSVSAEEEDLPF
ncbi:MAG: single-stranded DNA-binding protein [bacterium]